MVNVPFGVHTGLFYILYFCCPIKHIKNVYLTVISRLDGQTDVDSPKSIKSKDANTSKLDKNIKKESPSNSNLGNET